MEPEKNNQNRRLTGVKIVLLVEAAAFLITLAVTFGPSKTGSKFSFADLFWDGPSAIQKLLVGFLITNALLVVLAVVGFLVVKSGSRRD